MVYHEIFLHRDFFNSNLTGTSSFSEAQIRTDGLKILAYSERQYLKLGMLLEIQYIMHRINTVISLAMTMLDFLMTLSFLFFLIAYYHNLNLKNWHVLICVRARIVYRIGHVQHSVCHLVRNRNLCITFKCMNGHANKMMN